MKYQPRRKHLIGEETEIRRNNQAAAKTKISGGVAAGGILAALGAGEMAAKMAAMAAKKSAAPGWRQRNGENQWQR